MLYKTSLGTVLCPTTTAFSCAVSAFRSDSNYGRKFKIPPSFVKAIKNNELVNYQEAIALIKLAGKNTLQEIDIDNLLWFPYRKAGDLDIGEADHRKATNMERKHKGALEFQGDLFLKIGSKAVARENLLELEEICWPGFGEPESP